MSHSNLLRKSRCDYKFSRLLLLLLFRVPLFLAVGGGEDCCFRNSTIPYTPIRLWQKLKQVKWSGKTSFNLASNGNQIFDFSCYQQALAAEVIKTIRDIISLNPLYKEFLAQLMEGGKKVADNPVHLADFGKENPKP